MPFMLLAIISDGRAVSILTFPLFNLFIIFQTVPTAKPKHTKQTFPCIHQATSTTTNQTVNKEKSPNSGEIGSRTKNLQAKSKTQGGKHPPPPPSTPSAYRAKQRPLYLYLWWIIIYKLVKCKTGLFRRSKCRKNGSGLVTRVVGGFKNMSHSHLSVLNIFLTLP